MKKLGERNYILISQGVGAEGTYDPNEIFYIFEEQLYTNEYDEVWNFLDWCHTNEKLFGRANYEDRFAEFKASKS